MAFITRILITGLVLLSLWGCYPSKPTYIDDYDLVLTNYNQNFDFSVHKTYALPDSIPLIKGGSDLDPDGDDEPDFVSKNTAAFILNQIRTNLNNNGWTETDSLTADMIILPTVFQNTQIVYYYDWWYWGWYYPGYFPGYGWGYPGYYPGYSSASTYKTGTLMMQMTYPDGAENDVIPVQWTCVINGLLETGYVTSSTNARIQKSINQAFTQSPYLK